MHALDAFMQTILVVTKYMNAQHCLEKMVKVLFLKKLKI